MTMCRSSSLLIKFLMSQFLSRLVRLPLWMSSGHFTTPQPELSSSVEDTICLLRLKWPWGEGRSKSSVLYLATVPRSTGGIPVLKSYQFQIYLHCLALCLPLTKSSICRLPAGELASSSATQRFTVRMRLLVVVFSSSMPTELQFLSSGNLSALQLWDIARRKECTNNLGPRVCHSRLYCGAHAVGMDSTCDSHHQAWDQQAVHGWWLRKAGTIYCRGFGKCR